MSPCDITSISGNNVAICHIVNATLCKSYGLAAKIAQAYPYADIYGSRVQLYNLNARQKPRDRYSSGGSEPVGSAGPDASKRRREATLSSEAETGTATAPPGECASI